MGLKKFIEDIEPHFEKGGKHEKWFALYEAVATGLFTPGYVTKGQTHIRDSIDLKRIMITVWLCAWPAMIFGMYNVGLQGGYHLELINMTGRLVADLSEHLRDVSGQYVIASVPITDVSSGLYILHLSIAGVSKSQLVTIMR